MQPTNDTTFEKQALSSAANYGERAHILVVDDSPANRSLLEKLIQMLGHSCASASNGLSAIAYMKRHSVDLVLLDLMMPKMDGFQVMRRINSDPHLADIPVIVVSGYDEIAKIVECIDAGADDFLAKPFNRALLQARINSSLERSMLRQRDVTYRARLEDYNLDLEKRVREQVQEITQTERAVIHAMASLSESRDPETGTHLLRLSEYCRVLALDMKNLPDAGQEIDSKFVDTLYHAAPLHDIGKVGIPDHILQKPGKLTAEEFDTMKIHTTLGAKALQSVEKNFPGNPLVQMGIELAWSHHERWDGTGYPRGLAGADIPLSGRVLALADVYDALTSKRCYKKACSHEESKAIILRGGGTQFDPAVIQAFLNSEEKFIRIAAEHGEGAREEAATSPSRASTV